MNITTTRVKATDTRGTRIRARSIAGSITLPWDYAKSAEGNAAAARRALIERVNRNKRHDESEILRYRRDDRRAESAPLHERQEARAEFAQLLTQSDRLRRELGHLLGGDYGEGAYLIAADTMRHPRRNRAAILSSMVARAACGCPARFARDAYTKHITPEQRATVDALFVDVIAQHEE